MTKTYLDRKIVGRIPAVCFKKIWVSKSTKQNWWLEVFFQYRPIKVPIQRSTWDIVYHKGHLKTTLLFHPLIEEFKAVVFGGNRKEMSRYVYKKWKFATFAPLGVQLRFEEKYQEIQKRIVDLKQLATDWKLKRKLKQLALMKCEIENRSSSGLLARFGVSGGSRFIFNDKNH